MTDFLIRLFVKDSRNTSNSNVRENYGKFAGLVGIVTNLLLFMAKVVIGLMSNSVAVIADAVNNLTDTVSSAVTWIGFKISGKPADADHPYGHARMEYVAGLLISVVIMFLGAQLLKTSVDKILHPEATEFSIAAIIILSIAITVKLWQCLFYRKIGKLIDSTTLIATSIDSRNDILATSAVLVSALLDRFAGIDVDGYLGAVVSIFILISGIQLVMETISPLLGNPPSKEMVKTIYEKILSYPGIIGLHDLNIHSYGAGRCYASVHCEVPAEQDIMKSHDIIDNIERDFINELDIHLVIHLDPVVTSDDKTNELKGRIEDCIREISPEIQMHDLRVVWGVTHTNIIFDVVVPFEYKWTDEELKAMIGDSVCSLDERYFTVITVDHDYVPNIVE